MMIGALEAIIVIWEVTIDPEYLTTGEEVVE